MLCDAAGGVYLKCVTCEVIMLAIISMTTPLPLHLLLYAEIVSRVILFFVQFKFVLSLSNFLSVPVKFAVAASKVCPLL